MLAWILVVWLVNWVYKWLLFCDIDFQLFTDLFKIGGTAKTRNFNYIFNFIFLGKTRHV